jgi:hypothetical protein
MVSGQSLFRSASLRACRRDGVCGCFASCIAASLGLCAVLGSEDMKRHMTGLALGLPGRASGSPKNTTFECSHMKRYVYHHTTNWPPLAAALKKQVYSLFPLTQQSFNQGVLRYF